MSQTAHLQVYISAIKGHVPDNMVECVAAFMEVCYLVRQDKISTMDLEMIDKEIIRFHRLRQVFIDTGVHVSVSLPRQHALVHYPESIVLFGLPNGLCSSITEAKHIKAVKEPWRRSSRNNTLPQMVEMVSHMEKMVALKVIFTQLGMLRGSTSMWEAEYGQAFEGDDTNAEELKDVDEYDVLADPGCHDLMDIGASDAPQSDTTISLAVKHHMILSHHCIAFC